MKRKRDLVIFMYIKLIGNKFKRIIFFKSGFTLTEIVLSTLFLAILAAGMLGTFVGAERFIILTKHRMEALNFVRKAMETLKGRYSYTDPVLEEQSETELSGILAGDLANIGRLTYSVSETPPDGQPDGYKKITVKVSWNEPRL